MPRDRFATTRWSLVRLAGDGDDAGQAALERLCRTYRPPVLAYVRAHYRGDDAEDLTQDFFTHLLEQRLPARADSERGRFRAFILTALKNFAATRLTRERALRRGGGVQHVEVDERLGDEGAGPEEAFEAEWARTVLREALSALEREAVQAGRGALFRALSPYLSESPDDEDYSRLAAELGMRRNTLAVAVHRLRGRLQTLVQALVADTTSNSDEAAMELRHLRGRLQVAPAGGDASAPPALDGAGGDAG